MSASRRLLLIEDDKNIAISLSVWLRSHAPGGALILDHALNIKDGFEKAKDAEAIILDLTLVSDPPSEKDQTLRLVPQLREMAPVIILTGYDDGLPRLQSKFLADGVSEYGADFVFPKTMLMESNGTEWLFLIVLAAIGRKVYEAKHAP